MQKVATPITCARMSRIKVQGRLIDNNKGQVEIEIETRDFTSPILEEAFEYLQAQGLERKACAAILDAGHEAMETEAFRQTLLEIVTRC